MAYQFPPDLDEQVKQRLASGEYASEDDVLRDAQITLRGQEEEVAAIQQGIDDMEAGRVKPLAEFDRAFRTKNNLPQDA